MRFDVVVIGGGPAGSTAAYLLAEAGFMVGVFDRAEFPRHKLCGGILPKKTISLLQGIFGAGPDELMQTGAIDSSSDFYEIYHKTRLIDAHNALHPFYFADRAAYDAHLLNLAKQRGAYVFTGEGIAGVDPSTSTMVTDMGRTVEAGIIVCASGAMSRITKKLRFYVNSDYNYSPETAAAIEVRIPRESIRRDVKFPRIYVGLLNNGYGWVFPNRDSLLVGVCGLKSANRKPFSEIFSSFTRLIDLGMKANPIPMAHPLPYGCFSDTPARDKVFLIGDAAGFCDPIFGEGIYYAHASALLAARAIKSRASGTEAGMAVNAAAGLYTELYRNTLYREFCSAKKLSHLVYGALRYLKWPPLWLFIRMKRNELLEMVHGDRSFSGKRRNECPILSVLNR